MKVLKEVNVNNWSCIKTCSHCISELEINIDDIQLNSLYYESYFICPICKEENALMDSEIPYSLRARSHLK